MQRTVRLEKMLVMLSRGEPLVTPRLATLFETTNKVIQNDIKHHLLALFDKKIIYYDYSTKSYCAKNNFLLKTPFSAQDLAIIAILKNRSRDKYSDENFDLLTNNFFSDVEHHYHNALYELSDIETFDSFKAEIVAIKNAIERNVEVRCLYRNKKRHLKPLAIRNWDGFWYLIHYDYESDSFRNYHLNSIREVVVSDVHFTLDEDLIEKFGSAINAYFDPLASFISVRLLLGASVSKYFLRKPISSSQRVIKEYENDEVEIELRISNEMEIIPLIQRYLPHIIIVEPESLANSVLENIEKYLQKYQ
jgi:predicted DNA-binding transcriptional regulator YafY